MNMDGQPRNKHLGIAGHAGQWAKRAYEDGGVFLAESGDRRPPEVIAADPTASWDQLLNLAYGRKPDVSLALARNHTSTADVLDIIADADSATVRATIAAHPQTVEETLSDLIRDPDASVRAAVARNPRLLPRDQVLAVQDASEAVRDAIRSNTSLCFEAEFDLSLQAQTAPDS